MFATEPFRRGQFIAEYTGKRIPSEGADDLDNRYLFEVNSKWTINGATRKNIARYINHGCKPNAEIYIVKSRIKIRARKRIQPGDEITYDYGKDYFDTFIKANGCRCTACLEKRRERQRAYRAKVKRRATRQAKSRKLSGTRQS